MEKIKLYCENSEAVTSYSIRSVLHEFQNSSAAHFCDCDIQKTL